MGWRGQDAYHDAERARQRAWLASLPANARLRIQLCQGFRIMIANRAIHVSCAASALIGETAHANLLLSADAPIRARPLLPTSGLTRARLRANDHTIDRRHVAKDRSL
jgi:hypothetical protein